MVWCTCCWRRKPATDFHPSSVGKGGRTGRCKACNDCTVVERKHTLRQRDPVVYLINTSHAAIVRALREGRYRTTSRYVLALPYTLEQLREHLISTLPDGYTWDDFLYARLELDHVQDQITFSADSEQHPAYAQRWALSNLRLLPRRINRRRPKRNRGHSKPLGRPTPIHASH